MTRHNVSPVLHYFFGLVLGMNVVRFLDGAVGLADTAPFVNATTLLIFVPAAVWWFYRRIRDSRLDGR